MEYWTIASSMAWRFGHTCRECRKYISKGDSIIYRDGRRVRLMYHEKCFSGTADPRTQPGSSYNQGRLPKSCFSLNAPLTKY